MEEEAKIAALPKSRKDEALNSLVNFSDLKGGIIKKDTKPEVEYKPLFISPEDVGKSGFVPQPVSTNSLSSTTEAPKTITYQQPQGSTL